MKRVLLSISLFMALAVSMAPRAKADGIASFSLSGTYSSGTLTTGLTAPGQNFTFNFTLPTNPSGLIQSYVTGDDFYLYPTTVTYGFGGSTTTLSNTLIGFYSSGSSSQSGGFFLDYCTPNITCLTGLEYQWTFAGPQQYVGPESNPTLVPSSFTFDGQQFTVWNNFYTPYNSYLDGGSATCGVVTTPEPSGLVLLVAGLLCAGLLAKNRA